MCVGLSTRLREIFCGFQLLVFSRRRQVRKRKILREHKNLNTGNLPYYLFDDERLCKCNTGHCGKKKRFEVELEKLGTENRDDAIGAMSCEAIFGIGRHD